MGALTDAARKNQGKKGYGSHQRNIGFGAKSWGAKMQKSADKKRKNASGGIDPYRFNTSIPEQSRRTSAVLRSRTIPAAGGPRNPLLDGGAPPAPEPVNYDALFKASLDRQRAGIDAQLRSMMGDISARQSGAESLLGRQAGETNLNYNQGLAAMSQHQKDAASGWGATTQPIVDNTGVDAMRGAMEQARADGLSDTPYLQQGTNDWYGAQKSALEQAKFAALSDIDAEERNYYAGIAGEERDASRQETAAQRDFRRQKKLAAFQAGMDPDAAGAKTTWGAAEASPDRGGYIAQNNPDLAMKLRQSKEYQAIKRDLTDNPDAWSTPEGMSQLIVDYQTNKRKGLSKYGVTRKKGLSKYPRALSLVLFDLGVLNRYPA